MRVYHLRRSLSDALVISILRTNLIGSGVNDGRICDVGEAEVARQYLQRRAEMDLDCLPTAPLIIDLRGREVTAEQLEKYLIRARTVRVAQQANGAFCAAVLAARKGKKLS